MGRVYKADIRRDVTCHACGTAYHYIHAVEVTEGDPDKFEEKVRKAVDTGVDLVPCPKCGKANPEMWKGFSKDVMRTGLILAALLVAILLVLLLADSSGLLFYGLIIILPLSALGYALRMIQILLKPILNRKKGLRETAAGV